MMRENKRPFVSQELAVTFRAELYPQYHARREKQVARALVIPLAEYQVH